jgi:hypothetical protein
MTKMPVEISSGNNTRAHCNRLGPDEKDAVGPTHCSVGTAGDAVKCRCGCRHRCNDRQPDEGSCEKPAHNFLSRFKYEEILNDPRFKSRDRHFRVDAAATAALKAWTRHFCNLHLAAMT